MGLRGSVGRGGMNEFLDVSLVQSLLSRIDMGPVANAPVTGICDDQTVFLIERLQVYMMQMPMPTGLVTPSGSTWFALNKQSGPSTSRSPYLEETVAALRSELLNFAERFIKDKSIRLDYISKAEDAARELLQAVEEGTLSAAEAASQARAMRNGLLDAARIHSSDIGRAAAEAEKATGLSMDALLSKYSQRLFQREFSALSTAEQDVVFIEMARAAGRPNVKFTGIASRLGTAGKGILVISIALAVYSIASSERPGRETVKQGVGAGVGFLGSLAGGAGAGLVCGPGAPICVGVGVFVGGLFAVLGTDFAFDEIWE